MSKNVKRNTKRMIKTDIVGGEDEMNQFESTTQPAGEFDGKFAERRRLDLTRFNGQDLIHVREYVMGEKREYPTKIGVCFTPGRLKALCRNIEEIDEELRQRNANASYKVDRGEVVYKAHLGAGIYASVNNKFNGVDLRRYWVPEGQLTAVPTRNGIYLPEYQWRALKIKLNELMCIHPELTVAEECFHQNQMDMIDCHECMPFGLLCI